jgi:hypothetical protein
MCDRRKGNRRFPNKKGRSMPKAKGKITGNSYYYPHRKGPNGKYEVTVGNLENESIKVLKDLGIPTRDGRESDNETKQSFETYVVLRSQFPPKLLDAKKQEMPDDVGVGNGSKVNVVVSSFDWTYEGKKGTSGNPNVVQVVDLVPFDLTGSDEDLLDEEVGYGLDDEIPE